jgi:hypothetical protein
MSENNNNCRLGRKMAKARKRTKESSVQTEEAKTDPCDNEVTAADLTGGNLLV